ncbi:NAD(P)H-binding protein [Limosilactobacillus equigenerosi]|uniref:Flavin reductase n=1 Tax=Limosilactobacillus equigenerosi DSM 18793 = JCM 14505 TaxID=1423742 RepID=A0A0R1UNE0_9LACO|nr:NAD(P)H-binding protein [Limosilactobacillus equigenerosi]KRL94670.1 flavin reductase [Limosilactobacillus equigenerosi DSM 18793 = JCM 14505]
MVKVLVVGASGRVGQIVVETLVKQGQAVVAASRHPQTVASDLVTPIAFDLHQSVAEMVAKLNDIEAIIFAGGSRGKDLLQTDLNGAVKLMQAAQQTGVKRFIMLSSLYSLDQAKWTQIPALAQLMDYNIAKYFADQWLVNQTNLDYTIVQAGALTEDTATGQVSFDGQPGANTIEDVANVLVATLTAPNTIGKVIGMRNGDQSIKTAIENIR